MAKETRDLAAELQKLVMEQARRSLVPACQNTPHGEELALGLLLMHWADTHGGGIPGVLRVAGAAAEDNNYHGLAKKLRDLAVSPPRTPMTIVT